MTYKDITPASVRTAIQEFDELGEAEFLRKYGFREARGYFLRENGNDYPSKAIVGAAHGYAFPEIGPLEWDSFSGGNATVKPVLERLGFVVVGPDRNPDWTRDEIILALEFYLLHRDTKIPGKFSPQILRLADEIRSVAQQLGLSGDDKFRNANGVYMKIMNLRSHDPVYTSQGKVGLPASNKLETEVWAELGGDLAHLRAAAVMIREQLAAPPNGTFGLVYDEPEIEEAPEGRIITRMHRTRERSRQLVAARKKQFLKQHGRVFCETCGFDFESVYGEHGNGFIECHHTKPVHEMKADQKTQLSDLALICANCHRMVHARRPWLSLEQVRELVQKSTSKPG
ncbi:HNH endonuclease [Paracoccus sp. NGMCC 1.201697]|uniref:HNH endonuclease n=1 Tax=Paracoccus broussonetiae subsp. drimophilus TaxID=3373869 RepID=A0ABW7LEE4_9RHOB